MLEHGPSAHQPIKMYVLHEPQSPRSNPPEPSITSTLRATQIKMAGFLVFVMAIVAMAVGLLGWNLTPKGMNQTWVDRSRLRALLLADLAPDLPESGAEYFFVFEIVSMIRSSILLTLTCCYLMWAITYMAQLHPLMGKSRWLQLYCLPNLDTDL